MNNTERESAAETINRQLQELKRWQQVMLGREERIQELKREVNELCRQLGEPIRYPSQTVEDMQSAPGHRRAK